MEKTVNEEDPKVVCDSNRKKVIIQLPSRELKFYKYIFDTVFEIKFKLRQNNDSRNSPNRVERKYKN